MNNAVVGTIAFVAGAAIGVGATWHFFKTKYAKLADEEIADVKIAFACEKNNEKTIKVEEESAKDDIVDYEKTLKEAGYTSQEEKGARAKGAHYVIEPGELGEVEHYEVVNLTYYADCVLTDENYNPISASDIAGSVGEDFASHFGDYEDDAVHIRNDELKIDFEILRVLDNYEDIKDRRPL